MIEFKQVSKSFGSLQVLDKVNLSFPTGEITVIMGRSGAGKSVIIKHILGLLLPDSGEILLDNQNTALFTGKQWQETRKRFGVLFQDSALFDSFNVWDNVAFPLLEHTKKTREEIDTIVKEKLRLVGLKDVEKQRTSQLSGGMRKRVALARAIVMDPEFVLFDEPTSGLDPIVTHVIDDLILQTQKRTKCTYIVITHDITAVFRIADRIVMLYDGKIIVNASKEEVQNTDNPLVKQFIKGDLEGPFDIYY